VLVSFSEWEMALVAVAAARAQMARGAWVGQVAVRAAEQPSAATGPDTSTAGNDGGWGRRMQALMAARAELMDARRVLRNVGGNLNDVARQANSTGLLAVESRQVLGLVERVVQRVDDSVVGLDAVLGDARSQRTRTAGPR
jgi:hypothetical protein